MHSLWTFGEDFGGPGSGDTFWNRYSSSSHMPFHPWWPLDKPRHPSSSKHRSLAWLWSKTGLSLLLPEPKCSAVSNAQWNQRFLRPVWIQKRRKQEYSGQLQTTVAEKKRHQDHFLGGLSCNYRFFVSFFRCLISEKNRTESHLVWLLTCVQCHGVLWFGWCHI